MKKKYAVLLFFLLFLTLNGMYKSLNLAGVRLTRDDIAIFKNKKSNIVRHSSGLVQIKKNNPDIYKWIETNLLWHLQVETTGFYADKKSSYIPYQFSLWELAPKKGRGATVALFDTGIAAFEIAAKQAYMRHQNLFWTMWDPHENYNCCNKGLKTFLNYIATFLKSEETIAERTAIPFIIEYCTMGKTDLLLEFLKKHGNTTLFNKGVLTAFGRNVLFELTEGRRGIMPRGTIRFFTPVILTHPVQQTAIFEFLPVSTLSSNYKNKVASAHGTHIYGLINAQEDIQYGGLCGIAPYAHCIMIKVCTDGGTSDVETVLYALKKAKELNADIINMSLKIETNGQNDLCQALEEQLKKSYFVVASGGNALSQEECLKEAYPACLKSIPFDIGAFSYDGEQYAICPFSQYEEKNGPKFVAPGFNILSTGIPSAQGDYLFLSGSSMATALMSGFVALMVAEFKEDFSREQLLKVCYCNVKRLGRELEWYKKSLLGVLDMRTVLFTLHVCKALKNRVKKDLFQQQFDLYVRVIQMIIEELELLPKERFKLNNLEKTIDFFVTFMQNAEKKIDKKTNSDSLLQKIRAILIKNTVDLFSAYDRNIQDRLFSALYIL